jgi:hypothetical protein
MFQVNHLTLSLPTLSTEWRSITLHNMDWLIKDEGLLKCSILPGQLLNLSFKLNASPISCGR